jgi:hypothetical protein
MERLNHELQNIVDKTTTPEERQRQDTLGRYTYYRVDNTGRSSDILPLRAPHNFGVSKRWYEDYREDPHFKRVVLDWMQWPGPDGWDTTDEDGEEEDAKEQSLDRFTSN